MKDYNILLFSALVLTLLLWGCSSEGDDDGGGTPTDAEVETLTVNVDVVLPADIQNEWVNSIGWAMENIEKAQQKETRRVRLNLRFHDENSDNLDSLAARLAHPEEGDDTCHAIVGPYHSSNAQTFLSHAAQRRLPVLMPTCTSAELQRIYARSTNAWFFTESDITQCEIMVSVARAIHASDVALVYSDDSYGNSFADWYSFYAVEQGVSVAGAGATAYEHGTDLTDFLEGVGQSVEGNKVLILVALSNAEDYEDVCRQVHNFSRSPEIMGVEFVALCSDTSDSNAVIEAEDFFDFDYGITPVGSAEYGFPQAYEGKFPRRSKNGEAQIYDALTLIALGAAKQWAQPDKCMVNGDPVVYNKAPYEPGLTDYMRSIVASWDGKSAKWDEAGLAISFHELLAGREVSITGATGSLFFDEMTYTNILNTSYMLWQLIHEETSDGGTDCYVQPLVYLSTSGTSSQASTTTVWQMDKNWVQEFDEEQVDNQLPEVADRWAVVVSPSTTWANYRHQADAFAMYQLLRQAGYDDDHIVLIVEDNLAFNEKNSYPGEIFVTLTDDGEENEEVRHGAVVDYAFSDLQPDDLADIMMGHSSERLPHVIHPTSASNVFFFWSGHGGQREGPLWGNEDATAYFGLERIYNIVGEMDEKDLYRRMMLAIETCFSGKWGQTLWGYPDVLVVTAASPYEESKADVYNNTLGVYLSNAFARTFRDMLAARSGSMISIYDLYKELARTTVGSHVMLYNQQQYGSVYRETMDDFFP